MSAWTNTLSLLWLHQGEIFLIIPDVFGILGNSEAKLELKFKLNKSVILNIFPPARQI